jgi:hypothetical protein
MLALKRQDLSEHLGNWRRMFPESFLRSYLERRRSTDGGKDREAGTRAHFLHSEMKTIPAGI